MQTPEELLKQIENQEKEDAAERGDIPAITRLNIDVAGTRGRRYKGEFVYKVPTLADQIQVGKLKSAYLPQGGAADANAAILVEQICYLAVTIQDPKPSWWQPFSMYDAAPVGALYGEALNYERKFHGTAEIGEGDESGTESTQSDEDAGSDSPSQAHVGRKVRPATERRETIVTHSTRSG